MRTTLWACCTNSWGIPSPSACSSVLPRMLLYTLCKYSRITAWFTSYKITVTLDYTPLQNIISHEQTNKPWLLPKFSAWFRLNLLVFIQPVTNDKHRSDGDIVFISFHLYQSWQPIVTITVKVANICSKFSTDIYYYSN